MKLASPRIITSGGSTWPKARTITIVIKGSRDPPCQENKQKIFVMYSSNFSECNYDGYL